MNLAQLQKIKEWYARYVDQFTDPSGRLHPFLQLKKDHSQRVAENARQLAEMSAWKPESIHRAEALGWLHDIGRFLQFKTYKTFSDPLSVNHGEYGCNVVRDAKILLFLSDDEQHLLLDGIRYHNARTEPDYLNGESLRFLKLIRDADKLDIFHVVIESLKRDGFKDLPQMLPQIKLDGAVSPQIIDSILTHHSCSVTDVQSLTDYLLLQLSWIYDLNYPSTHRLVVQRDIINQLKIFLPKTTPIQEIIQNVSDSVLHEKPR